MLGTEIGQPVVGLRRCWISNNSNRNDYFNVRGITGMKWEKASAIAEIVSSVAVLVTLVYVGVQTRELAAQTEVNTAAIIGSSRQGALNAELQLVRLIADYPITNWRNTPDVLDDDTVRRNMAAVMLFRIRENQWLEYRDGQLDRETWNSYSTIFVGLIVRDPFLSSLWRQNAVLLDSGFVREIERMLPSALAKKEGTQAAP
jgi:hypothetical protein